MTMALFWPLRPGSLSAILLNCVCCSLPVKGNKTAKNLEKGETLRLPIQRTRMKIIYLLTPWSRVLLDKLTPSQLVKKFPALHGNQRLITAFTSACYPSLS